MPLAQLRCALLAGLAPPVETLAPLELAPRARCRVAGAADGELEVGGRDAKASVRRARSSLGSGSWLRGAALRLRSPSGQRDRQIASFGGQRALVAGCLRTWNPPCGAPTQQGGADWMPLDLPRRGALGLSSVGAGPGLALELRGLWLFGAQGRRRGA